MTADGWATRNGRHKDNHLGNQLQRHQAQWKCSAGFNSWDTKDIPRQAAVVTCQKLDGNLYKYVYIHIYIYTIYNVYGIGMHCCLHCYPCHSIDANNAKGNISTVLTLTRPLGHCPLLVVIDLPKANCCQVLQCKAALVGTCWHVLAHIGTQWSTG